VHTNAKRDRVDTSVPDVRREEAFRHGRGPDPQPDHPLTASPRAMARSAERHHPAGEETVVETEEVHE